MHRTVFEFLDSAETWKLECLDFREPDSAIDSAISLCNATSALLDEYPSNFELLSSALDWGARADNGVPSSRTHIFWNLQKIWIVRPDSYPGHLLRHSPQPDDTAPVHLTMCLAAEFGAVNFMASNKPLLAELCAVQPGCACRSLLYSALEQPLTTAINLPPYPFLEYSEKSITFLLSSGCNPNGVSPDRNGAINTPWKTWLRRMTDCRSLDEKLVLLGLEVTRAFLDSGTDRGAMLNSLKVASWMHPNEWLTEVRARM